MSLAGLFCKLHHNYHWYWNRRSRLFHKNFHPCLQITPATGCRHRSHGSKAVEYGDGALQCHFEDRAAPAEPPWNVVHKNSHPILGQTDEAHPHHSALIRRQGMENRYDPCGVSLKRNLPNQWNSRCRHKDCRLRPGSIH